MTVINIHQVEFQILTAEDAKVTVLSGVVIVTQVSKVPGSPASKEPTASKTFVPNYQTIR
jgi:hypothetical protein